MMGEDELARRGETLVVLSHGIRQSSRLAEQLTSDAIVGNEARGLLGRLRAIRVEIDAMASSVPPLRHVQNDPFWSGQPKSLCRSGST